MGSFHCQIYRQQRYLHSWFVRIGDFQKHLFYRSPPSASVGNNAVLKRRIAYKRDIFRGNVFQAASYACGVKAPHLNQNSSNNIASEISTFDHTSPLLTFLKDQEDLPSLDIHELFQKVKGICLSQGEKEVHCISEGHTVYGSPYSMDNTVWEALRRLPTRESISFLQLVLQDQEKSVPIVGLQNVAVKISKNLVTRRDRMNENEFEMFVKCLQIPSSCGHPFYHDLRNEVDFDFKIMEALRYLAEEKNLCLKIWPSLLLNLAKANIDFKLEPLPLLCQQVFQQIDQILINDLKTLAELVSILKKETSWYASNLLQIFQDRLCEIWYPSVFTSIVCSIIHLSSSRTKDDIFYKFEVLFNESSEHTADDLIAMMRISVHFENMQRLEILKQCSNLAKPLSEKMSLSQIVSFLYICRHFYFKPDDIYDQLLKVLKENANHLTNERDVIHAADLLSQGHTKMCEDLVHKLLKVLDNGKTTDWSKICSIALRVSMHHPQLVIKFREKCEELLPEIEDVALLNTLARFIKLKCSPKSPAHSLLKEKFVNASYRAITPREHSCIVSGLAKLGLTPNEIDPFVWIQMRKFLPNLVGESSRRVLSFLGSSKFYHINPHYHSELVHLQRDVFYKLLREIPPRHLLLDREDKQSFSDANTTLALREDSWDIPSPITKSNVIGISLYLNQTKMYYSDILDKIVEVVNDDVYTFTPYEIRDVVLTLASCGVSHPKLNDLCQVFVEKLVTFFDEVSPFTVVDSALNLSKVQFFDAALLRKIFVWRFLEKTDKLKLKTFMSHLLMQLNRAVCLEYPEMQVPWFHHEVNMETHDWKVKWNRVKDDIYLGLCDLLNEDGIVKTGATTPYNYLVDFEFSCCVRDIVDVPTKSRKTKEKIAIDVLPRSCYFRNEPLRVTGEINMKRRHLEVLGYRYITIPYHQWDRKLPHRSDKVNMLRKHIMEQLQPNTEEDCFFQNELK